MGNALGTLAAGVKPAESKTLTQKIVGTVAALVGAQSDADKAAQELERAQKRLAEAQAVQAELDRQKEAVANLRKRLAGLESLKGFRSELETKVRSLAGEVSERALDAEGWTLATTGCGQRFAEAADKLGAWEHGWPFIEGEMKVLKSQLASCEKALGDFSVLHGVK